MKLEREQMEMLLKGAISSGKDVEATYAKGMLMRFKYSDDGRGIRRWTIVELNGGQMRMREEIDTSDL